MTDPILYSMLADVMVLNDIIEQAAGRHSRASDRGGKFKQFPISLLPNHHLLYILLIFAVNYENF